MKVIKGYNTTEKLYQIGLNDRDIVSYCQNGKLIKLKYGLYRKADMFLNNQNFIDAAQAMPYCVIARISALSFYDLTTFIPKYVEVDIPNGYKKPVIIYPNVKIKNADINKFKKHIITQKQGRYSFRIYDIEKTLCDCIKRRKDIGVDIVREALKTYLKHPDKNIDKLFKVAKKNHINVKLLSEWLGVML